VSTDQFSSDAPRTDRGEPDGHGHSGPVECRDLEQFGAGGGHHDPEVLQRRLGRLEHPVRHALPELHILPEHEKPRVPAWQRVTQGEPRWPVALVTVVAIGLQFPLPGHLVLLHPAWLLPLLQTGLLLALLAANPKRIDRQSQAVRLASLALIAGITLANVYSAARLVLGLIDGVDGKTAGPLLITGGAIWLTNIIVFALWYWEFDRGGPVARMNAARKFPDFQFAQMSSPEFAPPEWEPLFLDYLYLSFTNASAFSPTDVLPLSRWAKMLMLSQSVVSLVTVALVIARAVNIFN
jgi:uncharacterized membrane protein